MWDIWKRAWTRQPEECVTPTTSLTKRRFEDDPSSPAHESKRPRRTTNGTNGYPSYCTEEDLKILRAAKENDLIAVVYDVQDALRGSRIHVVASRHLTHWEETVYQYHLQP